MFVSRTLVNLKISGENFMFVWLLFHERDRSQKCLSGLYINRAAKYDLIFLQITSVRRDRLIARNCSETEGDFFGQRDISEDEIRNGDFEKVSV